MENLAVQEALKEKATAKMLRDAKAILNKLTPEKEENLTRRFVNEIQPDSYDRLVRLVNDLFIKAIEETIRIMKRIEEYTLI